MHFEKNSVVHKMSRWDVCRKNYLRSDSLVDYDHGCRGITNIIHSSLWTAVLCFTPANKQGRGSDYLKDEYRKCYLKIMFKKSVLETLFFKETCKGCVLEMLLKKIMIFIPSMFFFQNNIYEIHPLHVF